MALGAGPFDVLQAVLSRTVLLVTASAAVGLGLSLLTTALLGDLLYASADPWVYLVAVSLLGGVSLVACLFPARRAVHAPPLAALRYE
jgi:ABC-type antimicrobial peptide transport system permease subunit